VPAVEREGKEQGVRSKEQEQEHNRSPYSLLFTLYSLLTPHARQRTVTQQDSPNTNHTDPSELQRTTSLRLADLAR
jgi:hypothetical protein